MFKCCLTERQKRVRRLYKRASELIEEELSINTIVETIRKTQYISYGIVKKDPEFQSRFDIDSLNYVDLDYDTESSLSNISE